MLDGLDVTITRAPEILVDILNHEVMTYRNYNTHQRTKTLEKYFMDGNGVENLARRSNPDPDGQ